MNATRILTVVLGAVLVAAVGCKNSKYCDDGGNPCASGMTCNTITHACVAGGGGTGGTGGKTDGGAGAGGGKTDGGAGGKGGTGGSAGHPFRCDASTQCAERSDAAPICELDAASCVGCVKDKECTKDAPICQNNKCVACSANSQCGAHDAGFPFCSADSGACIECTTSTDCTSPTKPICNTATSTCVPCTADSQCAAKSTSGPGICMFQSDGHCATDAESVYVQPSANTCVPNVTAGGGSSAMPFCHLSDAVTSISTRDLIVLRGGSIAGGVTIQNPAMLSIVGQNSSAGMTVDTGQSGLHIVGGDLYVRGVGIVGVSATATIGIIADTNATLRLDGVSIENMPQGGLRLVGSGYDVVNSILEGNGGTLDDGGRLIGGAFLGAPSAGLPSRFAFNTIVSNKEAGVLCASAVQAVDASLLAANLGGGGTPDYSGCTLSSTSRAFGTAAPGLTATYRLMMTSPCVDFVTTPPPNPPLHDIDGVTRPQGIAFDCGASEYKP